MFMGMGHSVLDIQLPSSDLPGVKAGGPKKTKHRQVLREDDQLTKHYSPLFFLRMTVNRRSHCHLEDSHLNLLT